MSASEGDATVSATKKEMISIIDNIGSTVRRVKRSLMSKCVTLYIQNSVNSFKTSAQHIIIIVYNIKCNYR